MPKTVEEGFHLFINRLQPLTSEHKKASKHKNSVSSCLANNFDRQSFFETGSFGLGTGIRHHSDTDYFANIPSKNLSSNSQYCLKKVKQALQKTFPTTNKITISSPSVVIPFGRYKSETMEITPCTFKGLISTSLGKFRQYEIPDNKGKWMYSSPRAHNAYINKYDKRLRKNRVKHSIQLTKAWKYYKNVPISSFYLELRVTKYLENKKFVSYDVTLARILNYLLKSQLAKIRDPMGISGQIVPSKTQRQKQQSFSKLQTAYSRANKAIIAKQKGKINEAFYWWNLVFNNKFPSR